MSLTKGESKAPALVRWREYFGSVTQTISGWRGLWHQYGESRLWIILSTGHCRLLLCARAIIPACIVRARGLDSRLVDGKGASSKLAKGAVPVGSVSRLIVHRGMSGMRPSRTSRKYRSSCLDGGKRGDASPKPRPDHPEGPAPSSPARPVAATGRLLGVD